MPIASASGAGAFVRQVASGDDEDEDGEQPASPVTTTTTAIVAQVGREK
ncbi:MAG: hypothetical protein ACLP8X_09110 [Streptosporangiaceae bacterium]